MSEETALEQVVEGTTEAPVEAPAIEEAAPVEAKAEEKEATAAKFAALAREAKRVRVEKQQLAREKEELEQVKVQWSRLQSGDPVAFREFLQKSGVEPGDWVNRYLNEGKPTPETELAELKKWREDTEKRAAEERAEREQYQYQTQVERAKTDFVAHVETSAEKYPLLYEYSPVEIGNAGWTVAQELYEELGRAPVEDEVAEMLEKRLQVVHTEREQRRKALLSKKQAPTSDAQTGKASPKTLTNSQVAEKATSPREKTQDEIDAECIKLIESSWR